jgi:hypothetical protein
VEGVGEAGRAALAIFVDPGAEAGRAELEGHSLHPGAVIAIIGVVYGLHCVQQEIPALRLDRLS